MSKPTYLYVAICRCGYRKLSRSADLFVALMGLEACPECGTVIEGAPFRPEWDKPFQVQRVRVVPSRLFGLVRERIEEVEND